MLYIIGRPLILRELNEVATYIPYYSSLSSPWLSCLEVKQRSVSKAAWLGNWVIWIYFSFPTWDSERLEFKESKQWCPKAPIYLVPRLQQQGLEGEVTEGGLSIQFSLVHSSGTWKTGGLRKTASGLMLIWGRARKVIQALGTQVTQVNAMLVASPPSWNFTFLCGRWCLHMYNAVLLDRSLGSLARVPIPLFLQSSIRQQWLNVLLAPL